MSHHFFAIPALNPAAAQAEFNAFCQQHRVAQIDRRFIDAGLDSHWVLCVQVAGGPGPLPAHLKAPPRSGTAPPATSPAQRVDWKQVLSESEFTVFAQLRQARKALADRPNLQLATCKAARGRQQRPVVARYLAHLDARLDDLAASILAGTAPQGRMRQFTIHDPKRRQITAACFADRVLHHALLNLAEPRFEQALVPSSFACRPGLGVHAAVAAVQCHLQRWPWWVQVDVAGYFPSIDHALLQQMLARRFKGADHLALWARIIASGVPPGSTVGGQRPVGLPIGALTSQYLANAYLDSADRFLLALPQVLGHVRYMDDTVWWCAGPTEARHTLALLQDHLWQARRLQIKSPVLSGPSKRGLRFCGFEVRQGAVWPGGRKRQRFAQGAQRLASAAAWQPPDAAWQRAHDALHATLAHTQSCGLRHRVWGRLLPADDEAQAG